MSTYSLIDKSTFQLLAGFGLKLPTGSTQARGENDLILQPTLQIGTGSVDYIGVSQLNWTPFKDRAINLSQTFYAKINGLSRDFAAFDRYQFQHELVSFSAISRQMYWLGGASVILQDNSGNSWNFYPEQASGYYYLTDNHFKALPGVAYQLFVTLPDGDTIKSSWEQLPENINTPMGEISFQEVIQPVYEFTLGERAIKDQQGVEVMIQVPANKAAHTIHYKWDFQPTWIYIAPLAQSSSPFRLCWASNNTFLSGYQLHQDFNGGYRNKLFYIPTEYNERIFHQLSVLVIQKILSESYYSYWREIQLQAERGGLFAEPPYNLKTNLSSSNADLKVNGYFAVVGEQAKRWYFNVADLSYKVPNTQLQSCEGMPFPSAKCINCMAYQGGETTIEKPLWWSDDK